MSDGCAIWLTGLPASGKTTIARALAERLMAHSYAVETLDGDEIRLGLSADLGFSAEDRQQHNRRVIFVGKLLVRNGIIVLIPLISPYRETRDFARSELGRFVEVFVHSPEVASSPEHGPGYAGPRPGPGGPPVEPLHPVMGTALQAVVHQQSFICS